MRWLVAAVANACGLAVAAWAFDGIWLVGTDTVREVVTLVVVGLVLATVNEFVRPVVAALSACLYVLTLGLMYFVVNALMLLLTGWISEQLRLGYRVEGFTTALFGAVVVSVVAWAATLVLHDPDEHDRRRDSRDRRTV